MANRIALTPTASLPRRRQFVLGAAAVTTLGRFGHAAAPVKRPKVAAIYTVFHQRSHAHVLLENFLERTISTESLPTRCRDRPFYAENGAPGA